MDFVLNRDRVVTSTRGHAIEFKKGEPTHVPPEMWTEVQAIGAIPVDDLPEAPEPVSKEPADPIARKKAIFAAFERMVTENARDSFTGVGVPHAKALKEVLGFAIDGKERDLLWQEYKTKDSE